MEKKCKEFENKITTVASDKDELGHEYAQKLSVVESKLLETKNALEELEETNNCLKMKNNDLSQKLENISMEVTAKSAIISEKENLLSDLQCELKKAEDTVINQMSITSELKEVKVRCRRLENIKAELEDKIAQETGQGSMHKLEASNRNLTKELEDCRGKIEELQKSKESLEEKVDNLTLEISTLSKSTVPDSCGTCPTIQKELNLVTKVLLASLMLL